MINCFFAMSDFQVALAKAAYHVAKALNEEKDNPKIMKVICDNMLNIQHRFSSVQCEFTKECAPKNERKSK